MSKKNRDDVELIEFSSLHIKEKEASELFEIAERTIRKTFKGARVGIGEYDLIECIKIIVKQNNEKNLNNVLMQKRIDKLDIDTNIKRNDYVHIDDVVEIVSDLTFRIKSKLLSLHKKLPNKLFNQPEKKYEKIIMQEVVKILSEFKNYEELKNEFKKFESGSDEE